MLYANNTEFNGSGGNLICYGPAERAYQDALSPLHLWQVSAFTVVSSMTAGLRTASPLITAGDIWIKYQRCFGKALLCRPCLHSRIIKTVSSPQEMRDISAVRGVSKGQEKIQRGL